MRFTQVVKSIPYYAKWKYLQLVSYLYGKHYISSINLNYIVDRTATCHDCAKKGKCIACGCNYMGLLLTKKPCMRFSKDKIQDYFTDKQS